MTPADLLAVLVAAAASTPAATPDDRALFQAQARRAEDAGFGLVVGGEGA